jgi:hypothetical protein
LSAESEGREPTRDSPAGSNNIGASAMTLVAIADIAHA